MNDDRTAIDDDTELSPAEAEEFEVGQEPANLTGLPQTQCSTCSLAAIDIETGDPFCRDGAPLAFVCADPDCHDAFAQTAVALQQLAESLARFGACPWHKQGIPETCPRCGLCGRIVPGGVCTVCSEDEREDAENAI